MSRTWYHATATPPFAFPALQGEMRADVCVVGAGLTGLGAALKLAEEGLSVIVLDEGRIGDGASGRNGGQVHSGHRREQVWLEKTCGKQAAHALWDLAEDAKLNLHTLIERYAIECEWKQGLILADHKPRHAFHSRAYVHHLREEYGYDKLHYLEPEDIHARIHSPYYFSGILDEGAGHLHPLKFVYGLVEAAVSKGVLFFEYSEARRLVQEANRRRVETEQGHVLADWVLLAGDALMDGLESDFDAHILPIASTIAVTEPLAIEELLSGEEAVSDSRFVVNYFRPVEGNRLLFGGGESWALKPVWEPEKYVRRAMAAVYPQLKDIRFDWAWSGLVGITRTRAPFVRCVAPNVLASAGYCGHGVALAPLFGRILAEAVVGTASRFDLLQSLPVPPFPGGTLLRRPLLLAAMSYYALRDRL